ncbi:MAG: protein phosphatase 2C domain-containing protein [Tannerella sp.]|jgi:protein phosphatase|nr:protein phosphatase 2C domain-containing protein [Tannerella sp.]
MNKIYFQLMAGTDVGLQRSGNEDNFVVCADLAESEWFIPDSDTVLNEKGCLLVVADGMGGMNAGEIASRIAIDTIRKAFSSDCITTDVTGSTASIQEYMKAAIISADNAIKEHVKEDPDTEGMGTTVIMAWILDGKVYISWCGDSRAYSFHPRTSLIQLSKDHSYVQDLVDTGRLDKDLAFDHPNSNIITRSLGDPRKTAEPDFVEYDLYSGEVILLCTDGLSGMLRDREIEKILADTSDNIYLSRTKLIESALRKGGYDNVTVALCRIVSGANNLDGGEDKAAVTPLGGEGVKTKKSRFVKVAVLSLILLLCLAALGLYYLLYIHNPVICK